MDYIRLSVVYFMHVVVLVLPLGDGANILISSCLGEGSHFLGASHIGESLVSRGHHVSFLIGKAYAGRADDAKYSGIFDFVIFQQDIPEEVIRRRFNQYNEFAFQDSMAIAHAMIKIIRDGGGSDCQTLLEDYVTLGKLREEKFDVIIFDMVWPCAPLFSAKIGHVPIIGLSMTSSASGNAIFVGMEQNPSYVPVIGLGLSNEMTFIQRVANTVIYHFIHAIYRRHFYGPFDKLIKEHDIYSPSGNIDGLIANASLWLSNTDFAVEYPCPLPPNVISVGGLTTRPADPLSPDLENFMHSSGEHGVIVCTMGTYITSLPNEIIDIFAEAFSRLPQNVIWQLSTAPSTPLSNNTKILPWLPQNDLLGHPKTEAFFYQGGNNGFYEAIYHGVPLVVLPILAGDQPDIAVMVETMGLGVRLDKLTITSDIIYEALHEVTTKSMYKKEMMARSAIFRDRPLRPAERAAFWVEHALKHGGEYFRSPITRHGFIRNSLLDVYAFLILTSLIPFFLVLVCCRKLCRLYYRKWKQD